MSADFKTIADFRKDNGKAIRRACRNLNLSSEAIVAIDGSKFKAVSEARVEHLKQKVETVRAQMQQLKQMGEQMAAAPDGQVSLTDPDARSMATSGQRAIWRFTRVESGLTLHRYWSSACPRCPIKVQCTTGDYRRISRREHEEVLEAMQARLEQMPQTSRIRRRTVEQFFGTLKAWMGATHFLMKRLRNVSTKMSLHVLAYNLKRAMQIVGVVPLMQAMRA